MYKPPKTTWIQMMSPYLPGRALEAYNNVIMPVMMPNYDTCVVSTSSYLGETPEHAAEDR